MGRRLRSPRLPGVDVPGVDASMSPISPGALSPGARCDGPTSTLLADGVALRNRCPQGQADPRAAIAGGASGVTMARAGPHPRRARSMRWADVYVPHVSPASMSPASMAVTNRAAPLTSTTRDLPKRLLAERVVHSEWRVQCPPRR